MAFEVVATSVRNTHAFNPAVTSLDFRIPAVHCIVGHLILLVLSEPQSGWINPDVNQEIPGNAHESCDRRVANELLLTRFTQRHLNAISAIADQVQWSIIPRRQIVV